MDFDPSVITYAELVDLALTAHNPTWVAHRVQYASLILTHDDAQLEIARERAARFSAVLGGKALATRIEPLKHFWNAEDYHQKYYLRNDRVLAADFRAMFGADEAALRESTAAARVNGFVAQNGSAAQLADTIDLLGLSESGQARLRSSVGGRGGAVGCPTGL